MTSTGETSDMRVGRISSFLSLRMIAASLVVALIAGCNEKKVEKVAAEPAIPFQGTKIVVAAPAGYQFAANWKSILDEWTEQTGATAEVLEYPNGAPVSELTARPDEGNPFAGMDLIIFPPNQFGQLASGKRLATLSPDQQATLERINWIDLFQGLRENGASLQKSPAIVPLASPVLVLYYRRDLLDKAGLKPPQTWDDYQKLVDTLDKWAPGLTAVEPWSESFRATMFCARAVNWVKHPENYSVFFDIDTGAPLIDSPGFVKALESSLAALAKMPKEVREYSPADCRRELFTGKAALAISFESGAAAGGGAPSTRKEGIQIGVSRLPGARDVYNRSVNAWSKLRDDDAANQVAYTGFAGMCGGVSSKSPKLEAQAAWSLLSTLALDRYETAFAEMPRSPTRKSQTAHPEAWAGPELVGDEPLHYLDAVADSLQDKRLVVELPVVGWDLFRKLLTDGLTKALADPADPQKRLQEISAEWKGAAEKFGPSNIANSYRRVLGLPATLATEKPREEKK